MLNQIAPEPSYEENVSLLSEEITVEDAAYILGCSPRKILMMVQSEELPRLPGRQNIRFDRNAIIELTGTTFDEICNVIPERKELSELIETERGKSSAGDLNDLISRIVDIIRNS